MNLWEKRVHLAHERFNTRLELSGHGWGTGRIGVGFWARTWCWGDMISDVCFHGHQIIEEPRTASHIEQAIMKAFDKVYEVALRAREEFQDRVPCQVMGLDELSRIKIVFDERNHNLADKHRRERGYDRLSFSPMVEDNMPRGEGGGAYRESLISALVENQHSDRLRFEWRDDLNSYAEPVYIRDVRPSVWQYVVNPRVIRAGEVRVRASDYKQAMMSVLRPDGNDAGRLVDERAKTLNELFSSPELPEGYDVWPPKVPDDEMTLE